MDHAAFLTKGEIRFLRGYTNYYVQTDQGYIHQDESGVGGISAVWYCHPDWHLNWGGELVVYDVQDKDMFEDAGKYLYEKNIMRDEDRQGFYDHVMSSPMHAVTPVANRLVIFDSNVLHAARPPQSSDALRLSTALKLADTHY
uniref:Prolyl 4-hydroxylase alpha subunit Fe(2+) 2OG dioxygenase domain-containing protein n=1 Tax=Lotharella globosa TaxID=91324 RepID=A0A7S3YP67_9EUKA